MSANGILFDTRFLFLTEKIVSSFDNDISVKKVCREYIGVIRKRACFACVRKFMEGNCFHS